MPDRARTLAPRWLAVAVVGAATAFCFWPTLRNGFISLGDDDVYVAENPRVQIGLTPNNTLWALTTLHGEFWHPVTWLSLLADSSLQGTSPRGFHRTNVLIHALSAALLCLLLMRLQAPPLMAAALTLLFSLHPMRVESVAWISERKGLLGSLFAIAAILAYTAELESDQARMGATAVFYLLSLASKPVTIALPILLLALDAWPLRRIARLGLYRCITEKTALFVLSAGIGLLTLWAQRINVLKMSRMPLSWRLANAACGLAHYAARTLIPLTWGSPYLNLPFKAPPPFAESLAAIIAVCAVIATAVASARRAPAAALACVWFLLALAPTLGLIRFTAVAATDRYSYFAHVGLVVALGALAGVAERKRPATLIALALAAFMVATRFAARLPAELAIWRDTTSLCEYADTVQSTPGLRNLLAIVLLRAGRTGQALDLLDRAAREAPYSAQIANNLGVALSQLGRRTDALQEFDRALAIEDDQEIARNRTVILVRSRQIPEALKSLRRIAASRGKLGDAAITPLLGHIALLQGHRARALAFYRTASRLDPEVRDLTEIIKELSAGKIPKSTALQRAEPLTLLSRYD